jgi:RNA-binding protein Musashi
VGGIPGTATPESFKRFFEQFGNVLDSTLMMDRETQKPRGYGFITYDNDTTVERMLSGDTLIMDGKMVSYDERSNREQPLTF